jgi:hypothetical protein
MPTCPSRARSIGQQRSTSVHSGATASRLAMACEQVEPASESMRAHQLGTFQTEHAPGRANGTTEG